MDGSPGGRGNRAHYGANKIGVGYGNGYPSEPVRGKKAKCFSKTNYCSRRCCQTSSDFDNLQDLLDYLDLDIVFLGGLPPSVAYCVVIF